MKKRELGIAVLEAMSLAVIGLPIIISIFSIFEILSLQSELNNIVRLEIENLVVKPYKVTTGDQLWMLHSVDMADDSELARSGPELQQAIDMHHQRITKLVNDIELKTKNIVDKFCKRNCNRQYKVELRHAMLGTLMNSGHLDEIQCERKSGGQLNRRCNYGSFDDLTNNNNDKHSYLRIKGKLHANKDDFLRKIRAYASQRSSANYTLASGLYHAREQQKYGRWDYINGVNPNFIRRSSIYGLQIKIDLKDSLTGKLLKLYRSLKNRNADAIISSYTFSVPKKEV
jgi:hypothetical protein